MLLLADLQVEKRSDLSSENDSNYGQNDNMGDLNDMPNNVIQSTKGI